MTATMDHTNSQEFFVKIEKLRGRSMEQVKALAGDVSTRRYLRLFFDSGMPTEILQINPAQSAAETAALAIDTFSKQQRYFSDLKIAVPKILHSDVSSGWMFLEDLGDQTLQNEILEHGYCRDLYRQALLNLIVLAENGLQHPEACPPCYPPFDQTKFASELRLTQKNFFDLYLGDTHLGAQFEKHIQSIAHFSSRNSVFYCHRDYHSRNLLIRNGQVWIIDFQDARLGPLTYDLASLLYDPYVEIPQNERLEFEAFFLRESMVAFGSHPHFPFANERAYHAEYSWVAIQRLWKAVGTYGFVLNKMRGDTDPAAHSASIRIEFQSALRRALQSLEFFYRRGRDWAGASWALDDLLVKQCSDIVFAQDLTS